MDSSNKVKWETIEPGSYIPAGASCIVVLYLSKDGQKKVETLSKRNMKRRLAIVYNNHLLMTPIIQEKITGETISIAGVTYNEAQRLKSAIKR
jgi:preprotein translocase subunit SecD